MNKISNDGDKNIQELIIESQRVVEVGIS